MVSHALHIISRIHRMIFVKLTLIDFIGIQHGKHLSLSIMGSCMDLCTSGVTQIMNRRRYTHGLHIGIQALMLGMWLLVGGCI